MMKSVPLKLNTFSLVKLGCLSAVIWLAGCQSKPQEAQTNKMMKVDVKPPTVKAIPKTLTSNGINRTDDYYWLRERKTPK